jgi:hypothetical protein
LVLDKAPSLLEQFALSGGQVQFGPSIPAHIALGDPSDIERRKALLYQQTLEAARKRYKLELDAFEQQEMDRIARMMPAERERIQLLIRPVFEEYASKIGPARQEFFSIGGVPPRPPRLRQSLRLGAFSNERQVTRYGVLNTYIARMDAEARLRLQGLLDQSSGAFDAEILKLKVALFDREQQAEQDAVRQARDMASQVTHHASIAPKWSRPFSVDLGWSPARISVRMPELVQPAYPTPKAMDTSSKERTLTQSRIWAKMQGVEFGQNGRDATQEFEEWVRKITDAR